MAASIIGYNYLSRDISKIWRIMESSFENFIETTSYVIPVEFKNSAMETTAECSNCHCHLANKM